MASIRINPIYAAVDHEHPYLPLVGGTLTGTLIQNGGNITIKAATLDRDGADPSKTIWEDNRALNLMDKDGEVVGRLRIGRTPGGVDYTQLLVWNEDGSGNPVYNTFAIAVGKDGTKYYSVSDADKFRSDLGITPANIGAAAASHGNHVPTTQTADNAKFLRNDNTWQTVTPANIGALALSGGTVTGTTNFQTDEYDRDAAANTSGQYGVNVNWRDKDGERTGTIRVDRDTGGIMRMKIGAFTENSSNQEVYNWMQWGVDRDGTRYYSVSDVEKFRSDLGLMGAKSANGYMGLMHPDGGDSAWMRTTSSGLIPYNSGGASAIGTSTWPFNSGYFKNLYLNGTSLTSLFYGATVNRTANYVLAGPTSGDAAHATFRKLVGADIPLATTSVQGAITAAEKQKLNALAIGQSAMFAQTSDTSSKRWRLVLTNADPANLRADVSTNGGSSWSSNADNGSVYFSKTDHTHALTSLTGTLGLAHGGTGATTKATAWAALGGGSLGTKDSVSIGRSIWSEVSKSVSLDANSLNSIATPYTVPDGKSLTGCYGSITNNSQFFMIGFDHDSTYVYNFRTKGNCTITKRFAAIKSSLN